MTEVPTPIPSPCVKLCVLDEHQVCIGCLRSMDEIVRWESMDDAERARIVERVATARGARPADRGSAG